MKISNKLIGVILIITSVIIVSLYIALTLYLTNLGFFNFMEKSFIEVTLYSFGLITYIIIIALSILFLILKGIFLIQEGGYTSITKIK